MRRTRSVGRRREQAGPRTPGIGCARERAGRRPARLECVRTRRGRKTPGVARARERFAAGLRRARRAREYAGRAFAGIARLRTRLGRRETRRALRGRGRRGERFERGPRAVDRARDRLGRRPTGVEEPFVRDRAQRAAERRHAIAGRRARICRVRRVYHVRRAARGRAAASRADAARARPRRRLDSRLAKRERERNLRGREPLPHHDARLGRPDEQDAARVELLLDDAHHAILRVPVEIDQHVAAEHEIVRFARAAEQIEQIRLAEPHARAHPLVEHPAVGRGLEMQIAKTEHVAAKRIASVAPALRMRDRARADVERVDLEARRIDARVEQRHRRRIRLLARRARRAQDPQRTRGLGEEALRAESRERGERLALAEEPGLRHDEQFDQRAPLVGRCVQALPVRVDRLVGDRRLRAAGLRGLAARARLRRGDPLGERARDEIVAERRRIDSGLAREPRMKARIEHVHRPPPAGAPCASSDAA
ncbi:Uncharacterised protein [Burkholderia pseudomallei]|nr:Uncharacterised protein [Burkholderia pseudomallei]